MPRRHPPRSVGTADSSRSRFPLGSAILLALGGVAVEYVAVLVLLGLILFIVAGNRRYPGHRAAEWLTPVHWLVIAIGVSFAFWILVVV